MREGKGKRGGLLAVVVWLSLVGLACATRNLFVSCDGSVETGDGSEANPFVFISSAVAAMDSGEEDFAVWIAGGATCTGPENTFDMHIPATVSSVTFLGGGGISDHPSMVCGSEEEVGISFHYGAMGVFSWASIDVRGCGTFLHGTGGGAAHESRVTLYDSVFEETEGDLLRLTDVEKIDIQYCTFRDHSGMLALAHDLESGPDAYVYIFNCHVEETGGFDLNGYRNVTIDNNEFTRVDDPVTITADAGQWYFWATQFTDCSSVGYGGAINAVGTHGNATESLLILVECGFTRCSAKRGGAVYLNGGALDVLDTRFDSCSATRGAAIAVDAVHGDVVLDCVDNEAQELGGCLYLGEASSLTLGECSVTGNTAGLAGAAFACSGPDNELIFPIDDDDIYLADNSPESFENACVADYYDEDTWATTHWPILLAAVAGVLVVGVVLVAFVCFEVYKFLKKRRLQTAELAADALADDSDADSDGVAVEYDFSQPAAVVVDQSSV